MSDVVQMLSQMKPVQLAVLKSGLLCVVGLVLLTVGCVCATVCFVVWVLRFPHPLLLSEEPDSVERARVEVAATRAAREAL